MSKPIDKNHKRLVALGVALMSALQPSCNKGDRIYDDSPKATSELIEKLDLNQITFDGISMQGPRAWLKSNNTTADFELKHKQYRTEILEDKAILDFAWGLVITYIEFKDQKFNDADSLESMLDKIERDLKSKEGSTTLSSSRGEFSSGDIKGLSLDSRSLTSSDIETDQTLVIFTKGNHFWQVQIIGIAVSEDPDREPFEQLKEDILRSIKIER